MTSYEHKGNGVANEKLNGVGVNGGGGTAAAASTTKMSWWTAFLQRTSLRRLIAYAAVAVVVLVLVIVGAVVGTKRRDESGGNNGSGNSGNNGQQPSFPLDPRLKNSFWGIAYTPYGAIDCTATQANVTKDIMQLSQLTTRLRLYAADCNVTSLVVQAIEDLHVNMSVYAGIYVHPDAESYVSQVAQLDNTYAAYGPSRVLGVTVGNEYILNAPSRGDSIVNASTWLVSRINDYKAHLLQLTSTTSTNYTSIPVGSSDAAGDFINTLVPVSDYLFVNIHPWFSQNTFEQAAWFSWSYMQNIVMPGVDPSLTAIPPAGVSTTSSAAVPTSTARLPELFQGEFGWPTGTDSPPLGVNPAGSLAGIPQMQRVLDDWVCPSNRNGTKYFWFAAYDEPWKAMYGGVEQHWGLFYANGTLKEVSIPDCPHS
ncbi:glycoside hydrolase family 17 protein [Serendipita vermifera MAFF 305830]|uniref:glucan endo-1,3-beta-D-glucosidase n=1 Tax=Serendipita vermifera MAFF 305830 TaxID=933852 RepID=A0A0C2WPT8_SERVB|nr:glycoside hydrolase family 17 protein [Serendipita vermifera MAFF 305830]